MNTLTDADTPLLIAALEDAIEYRMPDNQGCGDCTIDEMCEDHRNDDIQAGAFAALLDRVRPMDNFIAVRRRYGQGT